MSIATLQDRLASSGARLATYRGAETPASFGDTAAEFRALLEGCAIFDMNWQAKLIFSGKDRVRWMNGMVTNNIRDLAPGQGVYCFILTPQGHNQGDLVAYNRGEYLLATTDREQAPKISATLGRYIIMDKVEIEDISDKLSTIGVAGPKSAEMLAGIGIDVSQLQRGQVIDTVWREIGISVARSIHPQMDGYEIWVSAENAEKIWQGLTSAGAVPVGSDALETYRIARGVPRFGVDLRERDLPQETGQEHALNFTKGCYIGQEIVERIRARGNVHRTFIGFEIEGQPPQPGTKIRTGDKDVGEITSSTRAPFPAGERSLALGYLRREVAIPDSTVQIGEQSGIVKTIPFKI
ncbi:MAG TPA: glycine cleavage T C-terminal barrel domain-containing protein [Terriglobales bacterium]|jgi:folate-binding protein YgfZ|nr:glycine cleavage T C-terminal barrel domain-containing protein [Terriglobales bacterium]